MAGLLLIAHAPLATSLREVVAHVFPNELGIEAVDVAPDAKPDVVEASARAALSATGEKEVLVLTDVFGATPCNVAMRLADGAQVRVASEAGAIVLPAEVTDAVRPGVVSIPHGWGHAIDGVQMQTAAKHGGANSNVLARTDLYDPLSGNAVLNGIPVELAAVLR